MAALPRIELAFHSIAPPENYSSIAVIENRLTYVSARLAFLIEKYLAKKDHVVPEVQEVYLISIAEFSIERQILARFVIDQDGSSDHQAGTSEE